MELSDRCRVQILQASCRSTTVRVHTVAARVHRHARLCTYLQGAPSGLVLFLLPLLPDLGPCLPQPHHRRDSDGKTDPRVATVFPLESRSPRRLARAPGALGDNTPTSHPPIS